MRIFEVCFALFLCMLGVVLVTSDDDYQAFYNSLLILHNEIRKLHDAKDLVLDDTLSAVAMERARKLINGEIHIPRSDPIYEMNFFGRLVLENNMPDATEVFLKWYNEIIDYDDEEEPKTDDTDSFTQIVWKNTTHLGLAMIREPYYVMVVAIYKPRGNITGEYAMNVTKKKE